MMVSNLETSIYLLKYGRGCWGGGAELLRRGLKWEVRNRRRIAFWRDAWLEERPLCESLLGSVGEDHMGLRVAHFWDQ